MTRSREPGRPERMARENWEKSLVFGPSITGEFGGGITGSEPRHPANAWCDGPRTARTSRLFVPHLTGHSKVPRTAGIRIRIVET
jgi:hypothetical protein